MFKIEDLTFIKLLKESKYGDVYLCKKGEKNYIAKKV